MNGRPWHTFSSGMALLLGAATLSAQTAARPNLSGIWSRTGPGAHQTFSDEAPPLQPWAKAAYDENREGDRGRDEVDPVMYCMPHGIPRIMAGNQPFEIVQTPDQVHLLFEAHLQRRRIYLDGRKMPDNYPLTYMGFSTGRYDGDTLVVETAGFDELTWLDRSGIPHTDALHLTERFRRAEQNMLEISFRFDDAKAFTRPWESRKTYQLKPDWEIMENIGYCEDRYRYSFGKKIFKGTADWQSPEQAVGR